MGADEATGRGRKHGEQGSNLWEEASSAARPIAWMAPEPTPLELLNTFNPYRLPSCPRPS